MHLKITKKKIKEGIGKYAKIVESYWDKESSTSRQRIVMNLGPIKSEEDIKQFNKILESMKKGVVHVDFNKIEISTIKEFGVTYTTNKLLEKYKIQEILQRELSKNKAEFDIYGIIKALIINRLIRPSSDLSAYDWICNDYVEKLNIKEHQVYRALDYLTQRKDIIEKGIFENLEKTLRFKTNFVHYDLTSTYFEGCCCIIASYGHSRDHRKDRKQVVIGLVMCDGIPIYHEVHKGNTVDKTTLKGMIRNFKKKFGIKQVIVVADRGVITEKNLDLIEDEEYRYVLSTQRRNNNLSEELFIKSINSKKVQSSKEVHREKFERSGKKYTRRYVLCLDKKTKKERLATLKSIKEKVERKLEELQEQYKKSQKSKKGKKMTKESLINKAFKILGKNKRIFDIELVNKGLKFSLNKENYEYEKKIAGKFLLVTNTNKSPDKIMKSYKELQIVENAFDEWKNFLDVRPIWHYKPRRVRAHIFVCALSFLIECIIEKFSSESARKTIREIERIKLSELTAKNNIRKVLTRLTEKQKKIFKKQRIPIPIAT